MFRRLCPCGVVLVVAALLVFGAKGISARGQDDLLSIPQDVEWTPCPVLTNLAIDGGFFSRCGTAQPANLTASCASFSVPLNYSDTSARAANITQFVKIIHAPAGDAEGQLILLNGGPGGSGVDMECLAVTFLPNMPTYNIVIPDHRGTGRSSPLYCGDFTAEPTLECLKKALVVNSKEYLASFTISNAARDLHETVRATAGGAGTGFKLALYGVSYGTFWAQRYLQLFPDEQGSVVLDGIVAPDLTRLANYDVDVNTVGSVVMEECGRDETCKLHAGPHPVYKFHLLIELLQNRRLPCLKYFPDITAATIQRLAGVAIAGTLQRLLVAPLATRMLRCNSQDVEALKFLFSHVVGNSQDVRARQSMLHSSPWFPYPSPLWTNQAGMPKINTTLEDNPLLSTNIGLSEIYEYSADPLTPEQLNASELSLLFSSDGALNPGASFWPRYPLDQYANSYPQTKIPLILLQGTLDPQTEYEFGSWAASHYTQPNQQLIPIPGAVHASSFPGRSPSTISNFSCGLEMAASFFLGNLNKTCLDYLVPPDFAGTTEAARENSMTAFGVPDMWGS